MINKKFIVGFVLFLLVLAILNSISVFAIWYKGTIHQHTGFSTQFGYDKNESTTNDQCPQGKFLGIPTPLEGHNVGNTTSEIIERAQNLNQSFITITDHTYCLQSQNFNTIKQDCISTGSFVCLPGEEVSTTDADYDYEMLACKGTGAPFNRGEAHIGAIGINNYIAQTPFGRHCPDGPKPQDTINTIKKQGGVAIINHPRDYMLDFEAFPSGVSGETGIEIWNGEWGCRNEAAA